MKSKLLICFVALLFVHPVFSQKAFDYKLNTSQGDVIIHVLGHSSILFEWNQLAIYVDPYSKAYRFANSPKADLIVVTHADSDHFDATAINQIKKESTLMIYTKTCSDNGSYTEIDTVMANGDSIYVQNVGFKAVPAYNIVKTRHIKGVGNGYIITFADKRIYISGDGEIIPEMADFNDIDVSFMGYSQPYNMTTEMFTEAARVIEAPIVIPYHYDNNDISELISAFKSYYEITLLTEAIENSGIKEEHQNNWFYPNPANEKLYSDVFKKNSTLSIYTEIGKKIFSCNLNSEGSIDVSSLSAGKYFFVVEGNFESISGSFIVGKH